MNLLLKKIANDQIFSPRLFKGNLVRRTESYARVADLLAWYKWSNIDENINRLLID